MDNATHRIFVPVPGSQLGIAPGSAIVCAIEQDESSDVVAYYEGNLYGAINLRKYSERALHAAGRQVHRYPTAAMAILPRSSLIHVGDLDYAQRRFAISDAVALSEWVLDEQVSP